MHYQGTLYTVTNLNDSGTGSIREALEASGNRTVIFDVAGTVALTKPIRVKPDCFVRGCNAPAGGICLRNGGGYDGPLLELYNTWNVALRYLRLRSGATKPAAGATDSNGDCISMDNAWNVAIEHCSLSWAVDENLQIWNSDRVLVRDCVISEGLRNSVHPKGMHSAGLIAAGGSNGQITITRCLLAHNVFRNPLVDQGRVDFINNVVYGWGWYGLGVQNSYGAAYVNDIGNYYKASADTPEATEVDFNDFGTGAEAKCYRSGNRHIGTDNEWDNSNVFTAEGSKTVDPLAFKNAGQYPLIRQDNIMDAESAYQYVLANAGAILPTRDAVDSRIIGQVQNGTGSFVDDPAQVGGWPDLTV